MSMGSRKDRSDLHGFDPDRSVDESGGNLNSAWISPAGDLTLAGLRRSLVASSPSRRAGPFCGPALGPSFRGQPSRSNARTPWREVARTTDTCRARSGAGPASARRRAEPRTICWPTGQEGGNSTMALPALTEYSSQALVPRNLELRRAEEPATAKLPISRQARDF